LELLVDDERDLKDFKPDVTDSRFNALERADYHIDPTHKDFN